jgi:hypothetical protein
MGTALAQGVAQSDRFIEPPREWGDYTACHWGGYSKGNSEP